MHTVQALRRLTNKVEDKKMASTLPCCALHESKKHDLMKGPHCTERESSAALKQSKESLRLPTDYAYTAVAFVCEVSSTVLTSKAHISTVRPERRVRSPAEGKD